MQYPVDPRQDISFLFYREVQVAMQMSHSWEESLSLVTYHIRAFFCVSVIRIKTLETVSHRCFFFHSFTYNEGVSISLVLISSFSY